MTELQKEKARWIEKYIHLAKKINMPEDGWYSNDLEVIKKRYASLYIHHMRTKHIDKPVDWIIKEEKIDIDIINAVHRFKSLLKKDINYDDAFNKISNNFELTADEMDQLQKLVPYKN